MTYGIQSYTSGALPPTTTSGSQTISTVTIDNAAIVTLFNDFRAKWRSLTNAEQMKTTPTEVFSETLREVL